jgi:DNA-binding transcriptional LysR family regulator
LAFKRNQLLYFVAVAEEGKITAAAAKLHVAQPALSQAIRQLESELGLNLFERHARGVSLTPAGHAFLETARRAVDAEADLQRVASSIRQGSLSAVTIGYLGVPPAMTNPELIAAFAEAHPEVEIGLLELPFPSGPTATWLAKVDMAIASQPLDDAGTWSLPLRREPRVIVAPRSHPLAERDELRLGDVLDETFVGFHDAVEPSWAGLWTLDEYRDGSSPKLTAERSINAQERFATLSAGRGITAMPACHASVVASILPSLVAIPLPEADPTVLELVGPTERLNPTIDALLTVARELDPADREELNGAAIQDDAGPAETATSAAPAT